MEVICLTNSESEYCNVNGTEQTWETRALECLAECIEQSGRGLLEVGWYFTTEVIRGNEEQVR